MTETPARIRLGVHPLTPRDPAEPHRAASPLELLFDLVFVVAVSVSSSALAELLADGHPAQAIGSYLMVFFAIWWAWMTVTWFGTSFDTDDWLYRIGVIVQMAGALIIAAGARTGILTGDFTWVVIGYVVLRLVAVPQWIRVAVANPALRRTAVVYALGTVAIQLLWIGRQPMLPEALQVPSFLLMVAIELSLPAVAKSNGQTPLHPHHITERFGLFTIIVLGESILASANAILAAIESSHDAVHFVAIAGLALVVVAAMWWTYFSRPMRGRIGSLRSSMLFGYFHYLVFASAGAFSSGVEVVVAAAEHRVELDPLAVRAALAVPVAIFLLCVWVLSLRPTLRVGANAAVLALTVVIAISALWTASLLITALACVTIVIVIERSALPGGAQR